MWFRRRPVLPTVSGYETRETSKVRPSLPLGAASSRRATPQPSRPVFFPHLPVGRGTIARIYSEVHRRWSGRLLTGPP